VSSPTLFVIPLSEADAERVAAFDCGSEPWEADLNDFIKNDALADQHKKLSRTYLFHDEAGDCAGFVTVLASAVKVKATGMTRSELRYTDVPALLIGRLAVQDKRKGQNVAPYMMAWVRRQARSLPVGCRFLALHVDRENQRAIRFYEKQGFIHTPPDYEPERQQRLMLYDLLEG